MMPGECKIMIVNPEGVRLGSACDLCSHYHLISAVWRKEYVFLLASLNSTIYML